MNLSKRLIINADDFGACREVNMAVMQIARAGILGGASVLANGIGWQQAVDFLRDNLELSAGIHLNVVEGRAISAAPEVRIITDRDGSFPGLSALLKRWILRPLAVSRAVEIEWRAQIEKLMRAGVWLKHADSHQHLHAFPPAYCCAVRLCQEYGIPALLDDADSFYAEVAREMNLRHDWITPYANELRFLEKPPLFYWLISLSYKLFGSANAFTARLPTALIVTALVFVTFKIGKLL